MSAEQETAGGLGAEDRTRAPLSGAALEALDRARRMADVEARPGSGRWRGSGDGRRDAADRDPSGRPGQVAYTGSGTDPRDPRSVGGLFAKLAHRRGWESSLDVAQVTSRWPELVGPDVAAHCVVERFEPPTLVVRTSSTTWATQLRILKDGLLDKIERQMGRRVVEDIEIHGPVQRSFTRGRKSVRGRGPRDTWG
jgi:predicted nucleic acid-binding Zn ribbon protein